MSAAVEASTTGQQGLATGGLREGEAPSEETSEAVDVETLRERQRLHNEYRRWMLANSACSSGSASVTREAVPEVCARGGSRRGGSGREGGEGAPPCEAPPTGEAGASSSSAGPQQHANASEAWEAGRKQWRARKGGYKRHLPVTTASMHDFNFEDYILYPGREFPVPIPLPDAVDMLVDIWLQEGMYD